MKISEQWLREWVNPPLSATEIADQITLAGLEVDDVLPAAPPFERVVVGKVIDLIPHPNADRLRVATVDVGDGELRQIVCGAPNVAKGMRAPTALIGATLPNGLTIKATQLREVDSQGMLCSAAELGLSDSAEGLMTLPDELTPGEDLRAALGLDDVVIDVDLTPNRSDCLSVVGIAREVAVLNRCPLKEPPLAAVAPRSDERFPVRLEAPADCPRFAGRVIDNVNPQAPTPLWMVERLRRAGMRSLGPIVDITNYVMLELGQPMHAYDLDRLQGSIIVRRAKPGDKVTLLNGQEVAPDLETLLITDERGPLALAGVMGGEGSGVSDTTRRLFLEVAYFNPTSIAGRARRYGLHTDASHRFERGVDPTLQERAMERATQLIIELCGGEAGPLEVSEGPREHIPARPTVTLRRQRLALVLGLAIPDDEIAEILIRLGMQVEQCEEGWQVIAPSFRFDIAIEEDLIEEIARVHGYHRLPAQRPLTRSEMQPRPERQLPLARLQETLIQRGYQEAITYSFVDPGLQAHLDPERPPLSLANPISAEMAVMRTTLWAGLVAAARHNQKRQQPRLRLFETGLVFCGSDLERLQQSARLGGLLCGDAAPEHWDSKRRPLDFFDLKGDVEALLALSGGDYRFVADRHPALHPGQGARIERGGEVVGWLGALHPALFKPLDLDGNLFLFELDLKAISQRELPEFQELSKYPASRRDLAFLVNEDISAQDLYNCIQRHGGELLQNATLFDVYRGEGLEENAKSMAFSLILQDFSSNLTETAVEKTVASIVNGVQADLNGKLR